MRKHASLLFLISIALGVGAVYPFVIPEGFRTSVFIILAAIAATCEIVIKLKGYTQLAEWKQWAICFLQLVTLVIATATQVIRSNSDKQVELRREAVAQRTYATIMETLQAHIVEPITRIGPDPIIAEDKRAGEPISGLLAWRSIIPGADALWLNPDVAAHWRAYYSAIPINAPLANHAMDYTDHGEFGGGTCGDYFVSHFRAATARLENLTAIYGSFLDPDVITYLHDLTNHPAIGSLRRIEQAARSESTSRETMHEFFRTFAQDSFSSESQFDTNFDIIEVRADTEAYYKIVMKLGEKIEELHRQK